MQTIFQFLMYMIFGKRWILWEMKEGFKSAIFVNEIEVEMEKAKLKVLEENLANLESDLKQAEEAPLPDVLALLSEDQKEDKKAFYDLEKKLKGERVENISRLKNLIASNKEELDRQNGEIAKIYAITYKNRLKYDFVREWKIKETYADKNK